MAETSRSEARIRRHERVRKHLAGTPQRPRLSVFRSLSGIYAQVIDDQAGHTLVSASTIDQEIRVEDEGSEESLNRQNWLEKPLQSVP